MTPPTQPDVALVKRLGLALVRYGWHLNECPQYQNDDDGSPSLEPCSCGYNAAIGEAFGEARAAIAALTMPTDDASLPATLEAAWYELEQRRLRIVELAAALERERGGLTVAVQLNGELEAEVARLRETHIAELASAEQRAQGLAAALEQIAAGTSFAAVIAQKALTAARREGR